MPFINRLLSWADAEPVRPAVVVGERTLSYGELAARAAEYSPPEVPMIALEPADPIVFAVALAAVVGRGRCAVVLDPAWPAAVRMRILTELQLGDASLAGPGQASAGTALADGAEDSLFYCGFTSGTTGVPKAFVRTVGSWSRSLERSVAYFGLAPGSRVFAPGPLSASLSLYALAESLFAGATFHALDSRPEPLTGARMGEVLRSERIEHFVGVPAALRLGLQRAAGALPDLQCVVSGGSKLSDAETALIREAAPQARIFEYYGASELSLVTAKRLGALRTNDVGMPFPGVQLRIQDSGTDEHGTVWVRTDTAIEGYLSGDDGLAFQRKGDWVTVGDQGWIDDAGALHLTGRRADMVVSAGTNVYPTEVELALAAAGYPLAVAFGVPDPQRGSSIAAVIEVGTDTSIDGARIREQLRATLSAAKVPRALYRTARIPVTAAGKPDRVGLRNLILAGDGALERIR
ncbi:acyl-CoA synthetase (AMP-forming)/AMP-acid ligase II [Arthrobacter pigmenti]|uniref:Acyl-CoA synthetase (AMP-forming)/AMP-acid ligase II n=1 Tax=Arthrobacter pigmenti TaxID=271432 RepID=A0A846RGQ6_9MICC|nr:AMP-binding protein [Arthrobacter pigmenti]NJC22323.1 acyl-CoA synthetase (AMP-forming)/AMP-acid ligase II [Arthrobacter pigmenti]